MKRFSPATSRIGRNLWFAALAVLTGCNGGPKKTNIEIIQNMMDQPSIKSQDWVPEDADKGQMLTPPPHTVPRDHKVYAYEGNPGDAEKNPAPCEKASPESLKVGKHYYEIHCLPCHGEKGGGDGLVSAKMLVKPRNLITAEAKAYSDGRIFYAITDGRGVMRPYASQLNDPDFSKRCAIIDHVRELQK